MGRRTRGKDLEIVMVVGDSDASFLSMVEGLYRGVVWRDEKVIKELMNELRVVWTGEANKWKKCGKDEKDRDRVRELALVMWMVVGEVISVESLIWNSLHFGIKAIIPLRRTKSTLVNH